jgi:single-strand DNA-binding protein
VDVTFWGRHAEVAQQYLAKGRPVFIEGRLQLDSWDDKQTGQKRSRLRVVAENLQMLGNRADNKAGFPAAGAQWRTAPPPPRQKPPKDPDLDTGPDDIPF